MAYKSWNDVLSDPLWNKFDDLCSFGWEVWAKEEYGIETLRPPRPYSKKSIELESFNPLDFLSTKQQHSSWPGQKSGILLHFFFSFTSVISYFECLLNVFTSLQSAVNPLTEAFLLSLPKTTTVTIAYSVFSCQSIRQLKLNISKIELLICLPSNLFPITISSKAIFPVVQAKNVGVILNKCLSSSLTYINKSC